MADQIANTTQSLTTAAPMRDTTKMLIQPNANWEEYLTPVPLSVAIMGELVFISSSEDFSINENPPQGGFKYIQYPNSFRACLMQVCNSGWQAFNQAHKNMDQIRIHTATVPNHMKTAVNILFNTNDKVINSVLPNQLDSIRDVAEECVVLAEGVEKKYLDVIYLIQELLEACLNAKHFYGKELENVRMKLEETKKREETAKQLKERSKKAMDDLAKDLDNAQDAYKTAVDSLPSGWEMIGMDFVERICSLGKSQGTSRYRVELSKEQLKHARESYQKSVENMEKNERELTEILCEMQKCDIKEMDFDTTIKMLVKGLDAMGSVKEQWEKMVAFFQMMSNIVKTSLSKTMKNFATTCDDSKELGDDKIFMKDQLYNQAFQASHIASLVHMISGTYTEVSNKYLMDRVSSLGRLMAMDANRPEFHQERLNLQQSCQDAQRGILQLVIKNKQDFETKTDERMEKIERELKAILPAAPPEETERIKEIV